MTLNVSAATGNRPVVITLAVLRRVALAALEEATLRVVSSLIVAVPAALTSMVTAPNPLPELVRFKPLPTKLTAPTAWTFVSAS